MIGTSVYVATLNLLDSTGYESEEMIVGVYESLISAASACHAMLDDAIEWSYGTPIIGTVSNLTTEWVQGWPKRAVFVVQCIPYGVIPPRPRRTGEGIDYGDDDDAHL